MNLACSPRAPSGLAAGISATADGTRWVAAGPLMFDDVARLYAATQALPLPSAGVVDCAGIESVDSSAVALLLAMRRRAVEAGRTLAFVGVPAPLASLAQLYGVAAFIES
jgi:ABC-type transporter Mla MlaB component